MAKRKYNKKNTKKQKKKSSKMDLTIVGLILLSILLAVLIYGKSGVIGVTLNEILGGMMGIIKYILPIGIFAISIKIACEDKQYLNTKLIQYTILLISVSVLISVYQVNTKELLITDKDMSEIVKDAYTSGSQGGGGGALGAILAVPLAKLLSPVGAMILCIGIAVMFAVFTFGINISEIINNVVDKTEENREIKIERKQQLREERLKIRQEKLEKQKANQKDILRRQALQEDIIDTNKN